MAAIASTKEPLCVEEGESADVVNVPPNGSPTSGPSESPAARVQDLPDLMERIERLGLTQEYVAFRDRYHAWRCGDGRGARGNLEVNSLTRDVNVAANRGFGYYYPNVQEWVFRRTMSYWIAVTFFEGAIFFTVSSFMYNEKERLNELYDPMTLYGYCCGKICFIICCYLMCMETVNFGVEGDNETNFRFYWNPLRWRTATRRLGKAGAGGLPYWVSIVYLGGVFFFTIGLAAELIPLPKDVREPILNYAFLMGAFWFALGGIFEGIQNESFTTMKLTNGWWGAWLNVFGGLCFVAGSIATFFNGYWSNALYGVGSALYLVGSSVQIVMWKDEQFGLTFLAVLNKFAAPVAAPLASGEEEREGFSWLGAGFVHMACLCGAASAYNFNIELKRSFENEEPRATELAVLELIPCILAHLELLLLSAVTRTPKAAPFRQLYILSKVMLVAMTAYCVWTLWKFLAHKI